MKHEAKVAADTGDLTAHRTDQGRWRVPWMPGRDLTEHEARAAVAIAERNLPRFGPVQAGDFLALARFQIDRAETMPGLPRMSRQRQWGRRDILEIAARIDKVLDYVGTVPDLGAYRAAEYLSDKLGCRISAAGVTELARRGQIRTAGEFKGHIVYDGHSLEAFHDTAAAEQATGAGRELNGDEAADVLRIRRTDFDHLARAGLVKPVRTYRTRFGSTVALYRAGDLADLEADRPDIDWSAVRATPKGQRSALAALPTATDPST